MKNDLILSSLSALGMTILGTLPVFAEETPPPPIDSKTCQYLTTHTPAPDVTYQPGVDVQGKPVTPADLSPPVVAVPETFSFDITVDVAQNIGLAIPAGLEAQARFGTVTYDKGKLTFNGQPLDGAAEAELRAVCVEKKPD